MVVTIVDWRSWYCWGLDTWEGDKKEIWKFMLPRWSNGEGALLILDRDGKFGPWHFSCSRASQLLFRLSILFVNFLPHFRHWCIAVWVDWMHTKIKEMVICPFCGLMLIKGKMSINFVYSNGVVVKIKYILIKWSLHYHRLFLYFRRYNDEWWFNWFLWCHLSLFVFFGRHLCLLYSSWLMLSW